jgi:hypothetical protein
MIGLFLRKTCVKQACKQYFSPNARLVAETLKWDGETRMKIHSTSIVRGIEEFTETKRANEVFVTGRAWTAADLRRKVGLIPTVASDILR